MAAAELAAQALITTTWLGNGEDWTNASRWSAGVPGTGHSAQVSAGTVNVSDARSTGALVLSGGVITGIGVLTIEGSGSTWTNGTLQGTGRLVVAATGSLELAGSAGKQFYRGDGNSAGGRTIENLGTITVTGSGSLLGGDGGAILNQSGGIFDLKNDVTIGYTGGGAGPSFTNAGTIRKSAGAGTATFSQTAFTTSGSVEVTSGQIAFTSGVTSNGGTFSAAANTAITFSGGQTFNTGTSFTGAGAITIAAGTTTLSGSLNASLLNFSDGNLHGTATASGLLRWTGGSWIGTGTLTIPAGSNLELSGSANKTYFRGDGNSDGGRIIENFGTMTWTGTGHLLGGDGAQIINRGSGVFAVNNDATLGYTGGGAGPTFTNLGTFRKADSTGTTTVSGMGFVNAGTITTESGNLVFASGVTSNGGTFTAGAGTGITFSGGQSFNNGTSFNATGSIRIAAGDTNVAGTLTSSGLEFAGGALAGSATVNGTLTWTGGSWRGANILDFTTGSTLTLAGAADKTLVRGDGNSTGGRVVRTAGLLKWTDAGAITGYDRAGVEILTGGVFEIRNDSTFTYGGGGSIPYLSNAGTVRKLSATGTTSFASVDFSNSGRLEIQSGNIVFSGGGGLANSGTVEVQAGHLTLGSSGATSSGGTFNVLTGTELRFTGGTNVLVNSTITGAGLTDVNGGTVIAAGTGVTGRLRLTAGTIGGAGVLTINTGGTFTWSGGNLTETGTLSIAAGGDMFIEGATEKRFYRGDGNSTGGRVITNLGTITWSGAGNILGGDGAQIQNQAGGIFDITGDATFGYTGGGSRPTFTNAGTLRKSSGAGVTLFSQPFTNAGTVESKSGTVRFSGGGSGTGRFIANGGEIDFAASFTLGDGTKLSGPNLLRLTGGTLSIPNLATVTVGDATAAGWLALESGALNGAGLLLVDGQSRLDWSNTVLIGTGTLRIAAGGKLEIIGSFEHSFYRGDGNSTGGRTIENFGTVNWREGNLRGGDGAPFINRANAVFDVSTGGTLGYTGGGAGPSFTNEGTFRKSAGALTTVAQTTFTSTGRVEVLSGSLQFSSGVTSNGGTFHADTTATSLTFGGGQTFNTGTIFSGPGVHQLSGGDTVLSGDITASRLVFAGGSLYGASRLLGTLEWTGGDMRGASVLQVVAGSTLLLSGTGDRTFFRGDGNSTGGRVLENFGQLFVENAGNLLGGDGAQILNRTGGVVEVRNNRTFGYSGGGAQPSFTNEGILRKVTGTDVTLFSGMSFTNSASVHVNTGTLQFDAGVTSNAGTWVVETGANLVFNGGQNLNTGTTISGFGLARVTGGTTSLGGDLALQNFEFAGGVLHGNATLTSGLMKWTGGDMRGAETLTIGTAASLMITGTGNRVFLRGDGNSTGGRVIDNRGILVIENTGDLLGSDGATLVNRATGFVDVRNNATLGYGGGGAAPSVVNEGLFMKSIGTGTTTVAVPFTNTGTIVAASGILRFTSSFTNTNGNVELVQNATVTVPGALQIGTGFLEGWGTVNAPSGVAIGLTSGTAGTGGIVFAGNLVINGNVTLNSTALLAFAIGGATQGNTAGTGYGFMNVNGALTLGGALAFHFENGFWSQVSPAHQFTVAQASSVAGSFSNVVSGQRLFSSDGSGSFAVHYGLGSAFGANVLVLSDFQPIPEPSTWMLMGAGALLLLARTRRRH